MSDSSEVSAEGTADPAELSTAETIEGLHASLLKARSWHKRSIGAVLAGAALFLAVFLTSASPALKTVAAILLLVVALAVMAATTWVFSLRTEIKRLQRQQADAGEETQ